MSLNFSDEQKIILMNQFTILRELAELQNDDDAANKYRSAIEGIRFGYGEDALQNLSLYFDPEVSDDTKQYVYDVLNMYSFIYSQYQQFTEEQKSEISLNDIEFIGFDGHRSSYSFYKFVTRELERYQDVAQFVLSNSWEEDSHGFDSNLEPMVRTYKGYDSVQFITADSNQKFQMIKEILAAN
ncbi:YfbU family protein [Weissella sp. MSCH1]|uniref:YfbU family protein n=1 Tax=Weissella sp. MSCH1 TaxID=3383343 RepID=UPI00389694B4